MQARSERGGSFRRIQLGPDGLAELRRVAAVDQIPVFLVADNLRHAANASGNNGQPEHAGFQKYDPERLCERTEAEKSC